MSELFTMIDHAVGEALAARTFDVLSAEVKETARRIIVRKVASTLRDALTSSKSKAEEDAALTDGATTTQQPVRMGAWSREWWAALIRRIEKNQSTDFMMRMAASGAIWAGETEPLPPNTIATMKAYPTDGDAVAAWRPWFKSYRVDLPEWRKQMWVFLPSPTPPTKEDTTGPPDSDAA